MALSEEQAIAKIDAQTVTLEKVRTEVQALKDAAANSGNVSPALEASIGRLEDALKVVDDINEDATTGEGEGGTGEDTEGTV